MIQKQSKLFVNKLQIVQVYEANFNTMLKHLLGRRLMKHGEEHCLNGHYCMSPGKGSLPMPY